MKAQKSQKVPPHSALNGNQTGKPKTAENSNTRHVPEPPKNIHSVPGKKSESPEHQKLGRKPDSTHGTHEVSQSHESHQPSPERQESSSAKPKTDLKSDVGQVNDGTSSRAHEAKTAEDKLRDLKQPVLEKLQRIMQSKLQAVRHDLKILEEKHHELEEQKGHLQSAQSELENEKQKIVEVVDLMRKNLCNIPGFVCNKFDFGRQEAIHAVPMHYQLLKKAKLVHEMHVNLNKELQDADRIEATVAKNESLWRASMTDYMHLENDIVAHQQQLEELCHQKCLLEAKGQLTPRKRSSLHKTSVQSADNQDVFSRTHVYCSQDRIAMIKSVFEEHKKMQEKLVHDQADATAVLSGLEEVRRHVFDLINEHCSNRPSIIDDRTWARILSTSITENELDLLKAEKSMVDQIEILQQNTRKFEPVDIHGEQQTDRCRKKTNRRRDHDITEDQ